MSQTTIMIVGAPAFCSDLADHVRTETGLRVIGAPTPAAARSGIESLSDSALVLIDAALPDGSAFDLCSNVTQACKGLHVMMLGHQDSPADALKSLEAGAIDYFPRPENRAELMARLRAHLRSQATISDVEINIGPFIFRPAQRTLTNRCSAARVWLTAKETRLLRRLHLSSGRTVSPAELIGAGWNSPNTSSHTLHTHIYRLRSKLGAGAGAPRLASTQGGYMLVA